MSDSILDSNKKTILVATDALFLKTGLSRNIKALLKEWYKSGKYNLVHFCSGTTVNDPRLNMFPWPCEGAFKIDPESQHRYASDSHLARVASYGGDRIEELVKKYKPDIVFCANDIWSYPPEKWCLTSWAKNVNVISFITLDSLPTLDEAVIQSKNSHFFSWAKFGEDEIRRIHKKDNFATPYKLGTIHGAVESEHYSPISQLEKINLRKKFDIPQDSKIFFYLGRNQLRKKFDSLLQAYASYKKQNPRTKSKVLLHTSWTEGWNLNRIIESLEINKEDILTTHVCSNCKEFLISPYKGENQPCPHCGKNNSLGSVSITNGVADEEMKYIYGVADASISLMTSGGQEYFCIESLCAGLPLATVSYSCGSDFTTAPNKLVYELDWTPTREIGSCFIKAEPNCQSVARFMKKIDGMSDGEIREWGKRGRKWALENFDSKIISRQWEEVFDDLPTVDYNLVKFSDNTKPNPNFQPDLSLEGEPFIRHLYSGYLDAQHPDDDGMKHWLSRLNDNQEPKEQIAQIFQQIAAKDAQPKGVDIKDLLLKNDKKNLFFILKESLGDCIISLSLLEGARLSYPNHNINIVTEPKFFEVFKGCEFVDNLIPYNPILEQEMYIIGAGQEESIGDVFVMPAVATQKHLNYLSNNSPEMIKTPEFSEDWTLQTK